MIPLYTELEFESAKGKDSLALQCKHCKKTFFLSKLRVVQAMNPNRTRGHADFCSRSCMSTFKGPPVTVSCLQCCKIFQKQLNQTKRFVNHFCGHSCAAIYQNSHKNTGTRISKLEKWLQNKLQKIYPKIEFEFNKRNTIDSELDIYIPSLNLAFEINGIFHYEPIYGNDKLIRTQINDRRKATICAEKKIMLHIIDVSHIKSFTDDKVMKFLEIIQNIISNVAAQPAHISE